jgi:antitoxin component YwqK of YwqJK toxin-antitoxin module
MNKIYVLLLLSLCSFSGYAQLRKVYFDDKDRFTADSTQAASYGIYGYVSAEDLYLFKKYDRDGFMMTTGAFRDSTLQVPEGKFVYYDWVDPNDGFRQLELYQAGKERYVTMKGSFMRGKQHGQWLSYYVDGSVKNVVNYDNGLLNGPFKSFNRDGDLAESGQFVNGKKDGKWIADGGLKVTTYQEDQVLSVEKKSKRQLREEKQKQ